MGYINDFRGVGRDDVAVAGGKGAGLGELVRAGLPVPHWIRAEHLRLRAVCPGQRADRPPARGSRRASFRHNAGLRGGLRADPRTLHGRQHAGGDRGRAPRRLPPAGVRCRRGSRGGRQVLGHRRGPRLGEFRGPAGHVPQRARRRGPHGGGHQLLGIPLDRPGNGSTGPGKASCRPTSGWPWWSRKWSTRTRRESCSPPTPPRDAATRS